MSGGSGRAESAGITVSGGAGSIAASLDELTLSIGRLRECADTIQDVGHRAHSLDWLTSAVTRTVPTEALGAVDWTLSGVVLDLGGLARRLEDHVWRTRKALNTYWLLQREVAAGVLAARVAYPALFLLTTRPRMIGLLRDGRAAPAQPVPIDAETRVGIHDLASIVTSQSLLSGGSTVRVVEVPQADGTSGWIVQIPGTISWNPSAGEAPNDLTADLELMARRSAALSAGVLDALRQAQGAAGRTGRGDPVMLTGHSLGGIAAASIAASASAREGLNITHVVTIGSPVAHLAVPEDIEVLSLAHTKDVVTHLDLAPNPDRLTWTTVHRNASGHGALAYRETSRLASTAIRTGSDPSLARWAATATPFLGQRGPPLGGPSEQRVRDYRVSRVVTESRS